MTTVDTAADSPSPAPPPAESGPSGPRAILVDVLVVAVWSVLAGIIGGLVWVLVAKPPEGTRTAGSASIPSEELVKQVGIDGWFFVIALVGGLLSGVLLLAWRRRDPLLMVVLVALGGGLSSWVMVVVGKLFGPDEELGALRSLPDGSHVHEQLRLHAPGVAWVWALAAAFGALVFLWVLVKPAPESDEDANLR
jgi:hypothetical protein